MKKVKILSKVYLSLR